MTLLEFFQFPEKFVWDNFMRPLAALFQGIPILGGGIEEWIKEVDESYRQRAEEMGLPQLSGEYYDILGKTKAGQEPLGFGPNGLPYQGPVQEIAETEGELIGVEQEQLNELQEIKELLTPKTAAQKAGHDNAAAQQAALKAQFATNFSDPTMSKHFQQYLNWDKEKIPDWMMSNEDS
jgi:hypothetical protein